MSGDENTVQGKDARVEDKNVVQDLKERVGRYECCRGLGGKRWEMRMLYKSGRREERVRR